MSKPENAVLGLFAEIIVIMANNVIQERATERHCVGLKNISCWTKDNNCSKMVWKFRKLSHQNYLGRHLEDA